MENESQEQITKETSPAKKGRKPLDWDGYTGPYFGEIVKSARLRRSWTINRLARKIGCDRRVMLVVEECESPLGCELMTFFRVCSVLRLEPEEIIKRIYNALKSQGKIVQ